MEYSYNERAKDLYPQKEQFVHKEELENTIGFEDCDYISIEENWEFWPNTFPDGKFHNISMELHVPCRDPVDHILSQCNHKSAKRGKEFKLDCDGTDDDLYKSIRSCYLGLDHILNSASEITACFG